MASRLLTDLHAAIRPQAEAFVAAVHAAGIEMIVTATLRSLEEQAVLYAKGRTIPPIGRKYRVTNAQPGSSAHNYALALDIVPLYHGKPMWEFHANSPDPIWLKVGELGEKAGLEWFGRPTSPFIEGCHFQLPGWKALVFNDK
jgi:peptidoglycan LD-endopeptidase CwlK